MSTSPTAASTQRSLRTPNAERFQHLATERTNSSGKKTAAGKPAPSPSATALTAAAATASPSPSPGLATADGSPLSPSTILLQQALGMDIPRTPSIGDGSSIGGSTGSRNSLLNSIAKAQELTQTAQKNKEAREALIAQQQAEIEALTSEKAATEGAMAAKTALITKLTSEQEDSIAEIEALTQTITDKEASAEELNSQLAASKLEAAEIVSQLAKKAAELDAFSSATEAEKARLSAEIEARSKEVNELKQNAEENQEKIDILNSSIAENQASISVLEAEKEQKEAVITKLTTKKGITDKNTSLLVKKLKKFQQAIVAEKTRRAKTEKVNQKLTAKLEQNKTQYNDLKLQVTRLEEALRTLTEKAPLPTPTKKLDFASSITTPPPAASHAASGMGTPDTPMGGLTAERLATLGGTPDGATRARDLYGSPMPAVRESEGSTGSHSKVDRDDAGSTSGSENSDTGKGAIMNEQSQARLGRVNALLNSDDGSNSEF